jgi:hypothetical protein
MVNTMTSISISTDIYFVHSYYVDSELLTSNNRVCYLYILLLNDKNTYLCKYNKPILVSCSSSIPSVHRFISIVPKPLTDCVNVGIIDDTKLNIISGLSKVSNSVTIDSQSLCSTFESNDSVIKLNTKRRLLDECGDEDPLKHFIKTQVDFSCKESILSYIKTKYLKAIRINDKSTLYVPKHPSYCFLRFGNERVVKYLLDESSQFVCATNIPDFDIELKKLCYATRFSYSSIFHDNPSVAYNSQATDLILYDGQIALMVSKHDEICGIFKSMKCLKKAISTKNITHFQTNHPTIRKHFSIKRNICLPVDRKLHLKRVLKTLKKDFKFRKQCFLKKGVLYLNKRKISNNSRVYVHDFSNFYATTILRSCKEEGLKHIFSQLVDQRQYHPKLKKTITTLFGMTKRYCPTLFYRTLNETVRVMCQTYTKDKKRSFGICKDSFFTHQEDMSVPYAKYNLKTECVLTNFRITNINTYIGINENGEVIIKGIYFPPFVAARKIVQGLYKHLVLFGTLESLPNIILKSINLNESDFHVSLPTKLKASDFFVYGTKLLDEYVYCRNNISNEVYSTPAEPTLHVKPKQFAGEIDVKRYANEIISCLIRFTQTFNLSSIIDEHVLFESNLFLKKHILTNIFERSKHSHLPGFRLHACQLIC